MRREELPIPSPCQVDWDTMTPAGRTRFCSACKMHVHELSTMRESEARALLGSRTDLCVSYVVDDLGGIRFAKESLVPAMSLVRSKRVAVTALAVATLAACAASNPTPAYGRPELPFDTSAPDAGTSISMPERPPR